MVGKFCSGEVRLGCGAGGSFARWRLLLNTGDKSEIGCMDSGALIRLG